MEKLHADVRSELKSLRPEQIEIVEIIRKELKADSVYVSGITCVWCWDRLPHPAQKPRSYITSGYFGTLGYAFSTALGAQVARSDTQVVAISGNGGFMFNVQELFMAVKYGFNTVSIVFNNGLCGA